MDDPETIKKALNRYKKQKEAARLYYNKRYKEDTEFRENHKIKSRLYYQKNKEKIAERYQIEKIYKQALRKFNYYKGIDGLDKYKELYPVEFETYFKDK
jgi:hypothetical protein